MRFEFTVQIGDDLHDIAVGTPRPLRLGDIWPRLLAILDAPADLRPHVHPRAVLGSRRLAAGSLVRTGHGDAVVDPGRVPSTGLAVHVVGGRDAGRTLALHPGTHHVGRDAHCSLVLHDERVSRRHATLVVEPARVTLRDDTSTNGTVVEGVPVGPGGSVLVGDAVARVGDTLLTVRDRDEPALPVVVSTRGQHVVPVPRRPTPPPPVLDIATHPPHARLRTSHWLTALIPAAAGCGLAWLTHSPTFLLFALLSPVMVLGTALGERLQRRRTRRAGDGTGRVRAAADRQAVFAALRYETATRRDRHPDPVLVARAALGPTTRLWQRRHDDDDALVLRLGGTATASSTLLRRGDTTCPAGQLFAVPLTVDLRGGPTGFAGPCDTLAGLARSLVTQLAVLHPPASVELALFLADRSGDEQWSWARWLPHLGDRLARSTAECAELARRLSAREPTTSHLVAVVDRVACELPSLTDLFDRACDPGAGAVTALVLGDTATDLPSWCARVVDLRNPPAGSVVDGVDAQQAAQVARALAPLGEASRSGSALPDACHLLDVLHLSGPSPEEILARWTADDGRAATVLGLAAAGPVQLDLDRDGPHLLVAGTTGSGKSELLRTLVLGLALHHPPDQLIFVLLDYKGGAAFADCAGLPHAVGTVTDLDPRLTRRALQSLEAELRRRERLFNDAGASDLVGYRRSGAPSLARLVVVVDEFAALADTQPDVLHGLVSVARRGRSLGMHLILATQRPGVAVTPEIRANTACRIALRVVEPAESTDVIGVPRRGPLRPASRAGVHRRGRPTRRVPGRHRWRRHPRAGGRRDRRAARPVADAGTRFPEP